MGCMYKSTYVRLTTMVVNYSNYIYIICYILSYTRNPDPRSRPQFGQITKLLAGNTGYLLGWSDEDKQIDGEGASKLEAPLHGISYQPLL